jgi:predicted lipoprotein with Yx(FWY)xxD motif
MVMAIFAFAFVACGDDDDNGDNGGDTPAPAATTPAGGETPMTTPAGGETPMTTPAAGETPGGQPGGFSTLVATDDPESGTILTTFDGYTVYTFDNDTAGTSTCTADCASTWPPLPVAGEATGGEGVPGEVSTISRDDGLTQVTYDGKPLYMYSGDPSPGDTNGDGIGGVWHIVSLD